MLCSVCRPVILSKKTLLMDEDGIIFCVHHPTTASLQEAVRQGCHICSLVWDSLAPAQQRHLLESDTDRDPITNMLMATPQKLELPMETYGMESLIVCVKFDVDELWGLEGGRSEKTNMFILQPSEDLKDFTMCTPAGHTTASDEAWNLAQEWIQTCSSHHIRCNESQNQVPWYPTRLIDVGETNTSIPKLIITNQYPPSQPYLTLSHCWGTSKFIRLTSDRLDSLQDHIPEEELPLTFKESFHVTRRLGFRYIWIDSLCIMQDSNEDWLHEAALMHKVYSQSYFTIAASASADGSQGLFRQRNPGFLLPCETEIPWLHGNKERKYQLVEVLFWESQIMNQPLHRRGWVVQERLLSPRVLHFSSQQLVWECHELDVAEKYPHGLPPSLSSSALARFKGLDANLDGARLRKLSGRDPNPKFHTHHLWDKIVIAYTSSLLSYSEDKLIALSGIAKRRQVDIGDEYIAGMWRKWLASQLLWHVEKCRKIDNTASVRPEKYRAPSWSWASVDGVISPGGVAEDGILIEILEVSVTPATDDSTGLVKSGFLRLRGVLKELKLRRHEFIENCWWMTVNGVEIRKSGEKEWERLGPLVYLDVNEPEANLATAKYCLPVQEPSDYNTLLIGLILETSSSDRGTFRRIGMFQATGDDKQLHDMILARHENESDLPCESYDSETRMHTICIV